MKKSIRNIVLSISSIALITITSCKKEDSTSTPTSTPTNTNQTISASGTYSGIVTGKTTYTPTNGGAPISDANSSDMLTVTITGDSNGYYLDNSKMSGGPKLFSLKNQSGDYYLDVDGKSISYIFNGSSTHEVYTKVITYKYNVSTQKLGTLRKQ
jgi:hypothetical protein